MLSSVSSTKKKIPLEQNPTEILLLIFSIMVHSECYRSISVRLQTLVEHSTFLEILLLKKEQKDLSSCIRSQHPKFI